MPIENAASVQVDRVIGIKRRASFLPVYLSRIKKSRRGDVVIKAVSEVYTLSINESNPIEILDS